MHHILCFVIDVVVEMIAKRFWRLLTSRIAAAMDRVSADLLEMIGFNSAMKWLAGAMALTICFAGLAVYLTVFSGRAKASSLSPG